MSHTLAEIRQELPAVRRALLDLPNVVATGIGHRVRGGERTDELCIVCSVTHKVAERHLDPGARVPPETRGIATDVHVTGPIVARQARTDRLRPAPGGVSVGHVNVTAGTLGCLVVREGTLHVLSNNHVLAASNDASEGDPVLQPGPADGGREPEDRLARLSGFVPIEFDDEESVGGERQTVGGPCRVGGLAAATLNAAAAAVGSDTRLRAGRPRRAQNRVDAAIAEPLDPDDVESRILEIGTVTGVAEGELGSEVQKSGRTTELTAGTIEQVDVTVRVNYGGGRVATFVDQLMAGPMSRGGDSGSAVLDRERRLVGLLFAGSPNTTVVNRSRNVLDELGVSLPGGAA